MTRLLEKTRTKTTMARRGGILQGCLIAAGVVLLLLIIGGIFVAMNWKGWTAGAIATAARESINDSTLPESEKPEMIAIIEDFTTRFEDGDVTTQEFFVTLANVMGSEVFPIGTAQAFDNGYVQTSGLTEEEKTDGSTQLLRIAQGLRDGDIIRAAFDGVFQPVVDQEAAAEASFDTPEGETVELLILRDPSAVTDEQIKEVVEAARTLADENGVTESPEMIDLSDALQAEFDRALDESEDAADAMPEPAPADEGS
jgi:hypothetical protein